MNIDQILQEVFQIEDDVCRNEIAVKSRIKHFQRSELIVKEGQIQTHVYFLLSGAARGYTISDDGDEITDCITSQAGMPLISTNIFEKTASLNFQALLDGIYLVIPFNLLVQLVNEKVEILTLVCRRLAGALAYHNAHKRTLHQATAREKYLWFKKTHPDLVGRLKQVHVASYLGITPETLSKIKGKSGS
ncbi:MAG: Crp/Fnr family transcriptional regulator [Saccharofermentanales bacterium]